MGNGRPLSSPLPLPLRWSLPLSNLRHHQGTKRAWWKGLTMVRLQFALAIVMLNLLKWHKVHHGDSENPKKRRAREAASA